MSFLKNIFKSHKFSHTILEVGKHIKIKKNLSGFCDKCNEIMPPSGGIVTSEGLKKLVEAGYDLFSNPSPEEKVIMNLSQELDLPSNTNKIIKERIRMRILRKEIGDYGLCRNCFNSIIAFKDIDFLTIYPKAVLVLSPLPSKELNDDWFVKFLAIAVGSNLSHKDINHSQDLITKFSKSGMVSGIRGDVKDQELTDATFCEQQVNRAFPNVVDGPHRLRLVQIDDALHSNIMTTIAWVFPPVDSKNIQSNSKRNCTYKNKQIKLIDSGFQNYIICSDSDSCAKNCIHNLAELMGVAVAAMIKGIKSDSDSLKEFALQTGSKDYTSD